jgi:hypothetical protein
MPERDQETLRNMDPRAIAKVVLALIVLALVASACTGAGPTWTFATAAAGGSSPTDTGSSGTIGSSATGSPLPIAVRAPTARACATAGAPLKIVASPGPSNPASVVVTIATGEMIGKPGYPIYLPSDFTLPANADVTITVINFDGATPLLKGDERYAKATGVVGGSFSMTPVSAADPNGAGGVATIASALDPAFVSHTLTIPALGINIPISANARETFTIHTGAPGTFAWHCFDPCGTGPTGFGGAMAAKSGYMEGTATTTCAACC